MAAGSTETFASPTGGIGCFNDDLLKSTPDKFWTGEVVATASTGGFWEDDPEENVKRRVNELKRKFHQGRTLQIKHLPRDVTEEEVRELLSDFPVQSVLMIGSGTGSGMARVTLEDPEMLEEWDRERVFLLRNQRLPVTPSPTEMMLCVARLPLDYTEEQFTCLVCCCGEVSRSFLMISEKTGESKGYGFVEYTTKESALHAKNVLDGKQIENWVLCCDWLDSSHVTFESLHSKCLYVDQLPQDFRDMGEFRKIFSSVVNPPYCQIALKNGCPQNWGLVEFNTGEDAENTQVSLNGYQLKGQNIRTSYYIPGVRAINLYLKLLNDSNNKGKSALLPDPPAPAVFQQLQNLAKQNPIFAQNLQYIILTQIQSLQSKNVGVEGQKKEIPTGKNNKGGTLVTGNGVQSGQGLPGIGGQNLDDTGGAAIGDNARAALVILLAAQMQAQMGNNHPSLLGNPQMLAALQGFLKQSGPSASVGPSSAAGSSGMGDLGGAPAVVPSQPPPPFRFGPGHIMPPEARKMPMKNGFMKGMHKVPLLPNPPSAATSPTPEETSPGGPFSNPSAKDLAVLGQDQLPPAAQDIASFWNGLLAQLQNQNNLSPDSTVSINKNGIYDPRHMGFGSENLLMGEELPGVTFQIPGLPNQHGKVPLPPSHSLESEPQIQFPNDVHVSGDLQQTISTLLDNAHNLNRLLGNLTNAMQQSGPGGCGLSVGGNGPISSQLATRPPPPPPPPHPQHMQPTFPFIGQSMSAQSMAMSDRLVGALLRGMPPRGATSPTLVRRGSWSHVPSPSPVGHQRMPAPQTAIQNDGRIRPSGNQAPGHSSMVSPPGRAVLGSPVRQRGVFPHLVGPGMHEPMGFLEMKGNGMSSTFRPGWAGNPGPFLTPPPGPPFGALGSPPGAMMPGIWAHPGSPSLLGSPPTGLVTPVGQKRKYDHILPSPEPSPEGNYIGQHSQGLGGHYADSYFKRKKKN